MKVRWHFTKYKIGKQCKNKVKVVAQEFGWQQALNYPEWQHSSKQQQEFGWERENIKGNQGRGSSTRSAKPECVQTWSHLSERGKLPSSQVATS